MKEQLKTKAKDFINTCVDRMKFKLEAECNVLAETFEQYGRTLEAEITTKDDAIKIEQLIEQINLYIEENKENLRLIREKFEILVKHKYE